MMIAKMLTLHWRRRLGISYPVFQLVDNEGNIYASIHYKEKQYHLVSSYVEQREWKLKCDAQNAVEKAIHQRFLTLWRRNIHNLGLTEFGGKKNET